MKPIIFLFLTMTLTSGGFVQAAESNLKLTGDENVAQVLDRLALNKKEIHNEQVTIMTDSGSYTGKMVDKGNHFVVLEVDTERKTMGKGESKKVISQILILGSSIRGFKFEVLR